MDGSIGVQSAAGSGSTFWFTADLPETAEPAPARKVARGETSGMRRVLVADDNAVNQIVVEALLKRDGHDVVVVGNGALAVTAAER